MEKIWGKILMFDEASPEEIRDKVEEFSKQVGANHSEYSTVVLKANGKTVTQTVICCK